MKEGGGILMRAQPTRAKEKTHLYMCVSLYVDCLVTVWQRRVHHTSTASWNLESRKGEQTKRQVWD